MGLKITSEIATNGGVTSEAYLNIAKLTFSKGQAADVWVNLYLSEAARDEHAENTVSSMLVPRRFGINDKGSPSALSLFSSETLYQVAYDEIKMILEERGLTVIDVI